MSLILVSPLVTDHPQDKNVTIFEDSVILTCTAVGFPSPTITWFHNGSVEVNSSYITENVNYFTTRSTYSKLRAESDDTGGYFCVAAIEGYDNVNSNTVIVLVQGEKISHFDLLFAILIYINFLVIIYRCSRYSRECFSS